VESSFGSGNARSQFSRQERSLDLSLPALLLAFACLALEGCPANPPPMKPRAATVRQFAIVSQIKKPG
jgi:hypothetical protein